jgi:hypothetical protein
MAAMTLEEAEATLNTLWRRAVLEDEINDAISTANRLGKIPLVKFVANGRTVWRPADKVLNGLNKIILNEKTTNTASDAEMVEILENDVYDFDIKMADRPGYADLAGNFYPFLLTNEAEQGLLRCGIDLKPCQIFSEKSLEETLKTDPEHVTKHCLWNTLQKLLPDKGERALVQLGLKTVAGVAAKKRVLNKIAKIYNVNIRLHETKNSGVHCRLYKGDKNSKEEIRIGYISDHFFPNLSFKPTIQGKPADINKLIAEKQLGGSKHDEVARGDVYFRYRDGLEISTANILKKLQEAGYAKPFPPEFAERLALSRTISELKGRNPFIQDLLIPKVSICSEAENESDETDESEVSDNDKDELSVFYADFETFKDADRRHIPYIACAIQRGGGDVFCVGNPLAIKEDWDYSLGRALLTKICNRSKTKNVRVYFHNLRYDANFLYDSGLKRMSTIEQGSRLYELKGLFYVEETCFNVSIRDTYSYLNCKLSEFPKMFDMQSGNKWSNFPYDIFCRKTLSDVRVDKNLFTFSEFSQIPKQYVDGGFVDMYRFAIDYCSQDVRVLQEGFDIFRQTSMELNIDIDGPMTAASFAVEYLKKEGVLDRVEPLDGAVRAYVQESVVGGRVCLRGNEPIHYVANNENIGSQLVDFDAVSLYPSAMATIPGLPIGHPSNFDGAPPDDDNFYVATVIVRFIGKELHMSTLSSKKQDGTRLWGKESVKVGDVVVLNRLQIEDARLHQGVEFEFVGGLRWADGYNNKIRETITKLFEWRLRLKAEKNPLERVVKLIMNSAYGKFGQKPHDERVRWLYSDETKALTVAANAGTGFIYLEAVNRKKTIWKLKYNNPDFKHSNRAHCASLILARSKSIMYQVTTPLDDEILYTDTDSMILPKEALSKLNRPDLVGEQMGQFHSDLSWSGVEGKEGEVTSSEARILAKKTYVLRLENSKLPGSFQYHFRAKGIPNETIEIYCREDRITPLELYERIGDLGVTFDLTKGRPRFKQNPTSVVTLNDFQRKLGPFEVKRVGVKNVLSPIDVLAAMGGV